MSTGEELLRNWIANDDREILPPIDEDLSSVEAYGIDHLTDRGAIRLIRAVRANISMLEALEMRAVTRLNRVRDGARDVVSELALVLSESEHSTQKKVALADALTTRLPNTFAALESGVITAYKASKVADSTDVLSDDLAREVDSRMASRLARKDPSRIRAAATYLVHRVDPDGAAERARKRREGRKVQLVPGDDGMSTLIADLPAEVASAAYTSIDHEAHALRHAGDPRTLEQLRADVLAARCMATTPANSSPRAEIYVHAAATTLAGLDNKPCHLAGYGPINADLARELAKDHNSTLRRVVTDPVTGTVKDVGRTRYRPPAALDELVRVRDRECRLPDCHRPAHRIDLDHGHDFSEGGTTSDTNLAGLCRKHHRLKDHPDWKFRLDPNGTLTITTPTGTTHTSTTEPLHNPHDEDDDPPPF